MTNPDSTAQDVTDDLDNFYCHMTTSQPWSWPQTMDELHAAPRP